MTNPHTGKSVTVTINDRGPFVRGVGLDLSAGAAKVIGMRGTGAVCMAKAGQAGKVVRASLRHANAGVG